MKKMIASLFILGISSVATAQNGVYCQLKDFSQCADCTKRIPASCEDHKFNGSLETSVKPSKVHWLISNKTNGSDRQISTDNSSLDIQGLQSQKDFGDFLKKQKVTVGKDEKVQLLGVSVANETALYKSQKDNKVIAKMNSVISRNVASEQPTYQIGGIRRALKLQPKEKK